MLHANRSIKKSAARSGNPTKTGHLTVTQLPLNIQGRCIAKWRAAREARTEAGQEESRDAPGGEEEEVAVPLENCSVLLLESFMHSICSRTSTNIRW